METTNARWLLQSENYFQKASGQFASSLYHGSLRPITFWPCALISSRMLDMQILGETQAATRERRFDESM